MNLFKGPTLLLVAIGCVNAQTLPGDRILGTWLTPTEAKIEIVKCGDTYCGFITSMIKLVKDVHNPDASLRGRSLLGLQILKDMKYSGSDTWSGGTLYGPERGKDLTPKLVLTAPGSLDIKVTVGVVRKTVTWTREK